MRSTIYAKEIVLPAQFGNWLACYETVAAMGNHCAVKDLQ
jgi:hypothetical protein